MGRLYDLTCALLERIAERFPVEHIRGQGSLFVSKYLLLSRVEPRLPGDDPDAVRPRRGSVKLKLHCFHRGDGDRELHDHPWTWGLSLILAGGYREHYRVADEASPTGYRVATRVLRPGAINVLRSGTFHRVELLEGRRCWTLFLSGGSVRGWGFWDPVSGRRTPKDEFFAGRGADGTQD